MSHAHELVVEVVSFALGLLIYAASFSAAVHAHLTTRGAEPLVGVVVLCTASEPSGIVAARLGKVAC
jgi:hypothetical protein